MNGFEKDLKGFLALMVADAVGPFGRNTDEWI
jgi:hypothetical protein